MAALNDFVSAVCQLGHGGGLGIDYAVRILSVVDLDVGLINALDSGAVAGEKMGGVNTLKPCYALCAVVYLPEAITVVQGKICDPMVKNVQKLYAGGASDRNGALKREIRAAAVKGDNGGPGAGALAAAQGTLGRIVAVFDVDRARSLADDAACLCAAGNACKVHAVCNIAGGGLADDTAYSVIGDDFTVKPAVYYAAVDEAGDDAAHGIVAFDKAGGADVLYLGTRAVNIPEQALIVSVFCVIVQQNIALTVENAFEGELFVITYWYPDDIRVERSGKTDAYILGKEKGNAFGRVARVHIVSEVFKLVRAGDAVKRSGLAAGV